MKNNSLFLCLLFISLFVNAQTIERIEVKGRIIVSTNDIEGVTVFNRSSNKGTITNTKGEFEIAVILNDIVEVSALQFEKFTVKIDEKILSNKYFTVYLVERINKLDEVIITPYDMLSGNMVADVKSVETFNPDLDAIYFGVNEIYAFEFTDDYKSKVVNTAMAQDHFRYGMDITKILGSILKPIFKSGKAEDNSVKTVNKDLTDVYGKEFLSKTFKIPGDKIEAFIAYVKANNFDYNLLNENSEVELIEHLFVKSQQYLKMENGKD